MKKALIIIDVQNEYSQQGGLSIKSFENIVQRINSLDLKKYDSIVSVRHINETGSLFTQPNLISYPADYSQDYDYEVIKHVADSFQNTNLLEILQANNVASLDICGFMTQNCITYTALTALNLSYEVNIIKDLCDTIDPLINAIALKSLSSKVTII